MYRKNNDFLKGQIILINPYIHKRAKLSKAEFLERIKYIKELRTTINSNYISFYITSLEENNNLFRFHDLVTQGSFEFDCHEVFAVAIQPKLFEWFRSTDKVIIQKQIASWMAGTYFFNVDKRDILRKQVYKPLFEELLYVVNTYYEDYHLPDFADLLQKLNENDDEIIFEMQDRCTEKYVQVCREYYNTAPPDFLKSPFGYLGDSEWGVNDFHNFEFVQAYLNEDDWKRIVLKGNCQDSMHRAESNDELFLKWKHIYTSFDYRKNFVYTYYPTIEKSFKKQKQKREIIPLPIKNQVWNRDNGTCVICGSKNNLEFDHIIPLSKGGSSTYRNLQILCEVCNRKKSSNL